MRTEDVLTSIGVASLLGVTRRHVLRLVKTGALPATKLPGGTGTYLFDPADVRAFIEERARRSDGSSSNLPPPQPWTDVPLFPEGSVA